MTADKTTADQLLDRLQDFAASHGGGDADAAGRALLMFLRGECERRVQDAESVCLLCGEWT